MVALTHRDRSTMLSGMRRLAEVLLVFAALTWTPAVVQADPAGTITGGEANATWTSGSAAFAVSFDICGSDGSPTCSWTGLASVQAASLGNCSTQPFYTPGVKTIWGSSEMTANGAVSSGIVDFFTNGAFGQRLCLYAVRRFTQTGVYLFQQVASKLMYIPEPPAPPPTPEAGPPPAPEPAAQTPNAPAPTPAPVPSAPPTAEPVRTASCSTLRTKYRRAQAKERTARSAYRRRRSAKRRQAWREAQAATSVARRRYIKSC